MNPLRGIALKLTAVMLFIIMAALIKAVSDAVPPGQAVFFRSFFAIPVILVWLALRGELRTGLRVVSPMRHVWRGLIGTLAMGLKFTGLGLLPLPEVTALGYAAPLLTVVFAAMFLGERVGVFRVGAVALGLVGVLIVLAPRLSMLDGGAEDTTAALGAIVVLMGAVCVALAVIYVRMLVQTEHVAAIVFYFSITASVLSLLTLPFGWAWPTGAEALMLIAAGVIGGMAQIFLTTSYRYADAGVLAPFDYASMIFALLIAYFIFAETPTGPMLMGASLVIIAGIIIIARERQLGLRRSKARSVKSTLG